MTPTRPAAAVHDDRGGHLEKLARRGAASVLGAAVSAVFGLLLVVIVTNGFTPTVAGTLFSATSVFLILESIALLGTDTGLVKCLPGQLAAGRATDQVRTLVVAAVPVLALSLVAGGVLYVAAPALAPRLVGSGGATTMTLMLHVVALVLPVAALYDVAVAATRGTGSMRPTVAVDNIGRLGLQALGVLAVHLAGGGPLALVTAWVVPYVPGLVVVASWLRRRVAHTRVEGEQPSAWRHVAREFWGYTAPRAIARITQTALKRSDIVLVAALASPADAALYTAATRFIVVGQLFVQSVQQALSPHLASLFARGDSRAANAVFQAATTWSVIASWPFYLTLAGFSPALMALFGSGYHAASDVVLVLSLTMLLATACGPVDAVLLMAGRSWLSLRNSTTALGVNIGLNLLLIPLDGIRGAAISWSIAIVVRNLLPLVQVRRQLSMWPVTRPCVRVASFAVCCFGAASAAALASDLPLAVDALALAAAAAAYVSIVWSSRSSLDLDAFGAALRRRSRHPEPVVPAEA